MEQVIM